MRHPRPREAHREIHVVSPCGVCREMLADFAPGCMVLVPGDQGVARVPIGDLIPNKYVRKS